MEIECPTCRIFFVFKGGECHFKRTKNHFCSRKCQNIKHGLGRRGKQDKRYKIWMNVKKRAKKDGVIFELQILDIPEIPKICPILGIKIKANTIAAPLDSSPSLDRIIPNKGYIVGNIRIISNRANRIKSDATMKELQLILEDAIQNENL